MRAGGRPVFADIDAQTFALSPQTLLAALTPHTAAVMLVHIGGLISPQAGELARICADRGITLVEDAAHAHGASYDGLPAGSFGAAAGFSFFPTKVITCGEGGMILTPSGHIEAAGADLPRSGQGQHERESPRAAWLRLADVGAGRGDRAGAPAPAGRSSSSTAASVAARYDAALASLDGLEPLGEPPGCRSNFYKYIAVLPAGADRAEVPAAARRGPLRAAGGRGV